MRGMRPLVHARLGRTASGQQVRREVTRPAVADAVPRAHLIEQLCDLEATEVLIAAPAGYGMSTLAALWAWSDPRPFGWVSVDRFDKGAHAGRAPGARVPPDALEHRRDRRG